MYNKDCEERGYFFQKWFTELIVLKPPYFSDKNYQSLYKCKNKLIFIEKNSNNKSADNYIPCLFYRKDKSPNFLIYFHGNSEHIFEIEYYGLDFRSYLNMNIIMVEYPGYSIYQWEKTEHKYIFSNALIVYDWIKKTFNALDNQIFVCGRSLGTSPAIYLSSKKNPRALFIISAFFSLKNIGKDYNASLLFEEIFNSYKYIKDVKCPILLIHGKKDNLIKYEHSIELKEEIIKSNNSPIVELKIIENMAHNTFSLKEDIIYTIKDFINKYNLDSNPNAIINFPENKLNELYHIPQSIFRIIGAKIFNVKDFQFSKKIEKKNINFLLVLIDNNIAIIDGQIISIYEQKSYILDHEIDINKNSQNGVINTIFQIKNENLVCGTNFGNIIIYEKDFDSEEFHEVKNIPINEEIFKVDKIGPNLICFLSKNGLKVYDENNLDERFSINLKLLFMDFVYISDFKLAMLSENHLSFHSIKENEFECIRRYDNIKTKYLRNSLIITNKYLILAGKIYIYYLDYTEEKICEIQKFDLRETINFIHKIHDESFLISTKDGAIMQIAVRENNKIDIIEKKNFSNKEIYSLLLKNFKTLLFADTDCVQVWTIPKKESSCKFI
jgi:predicted esterase